MPERIYRVRRSGGKTRYLSPTGKRFTLLRPAQEHARAIEADGAKATIYYADVEWKEMPDGADPE
jgi:hypothetical protein